MVKVGDMATNAAASPSTVGTPSHRIVVGTDGSTASLLALEWAAHQAELTGASLEVIAVWHWPNTFGWGSIPNDFNPANDARDILEPAIATVEKAHPDVAVSYKIVEGHPALELVAASKGAELLVVGSRGHGEFTGMLIGSTSEYCVANAACPVVVIRGNYS
jgi:nucleotide-binding universal stress UspA family protein